MHFIFLYSLGLKCFRAKCVNLGKNETYFGTPCIRSLFTTQPKKYFFHLSEFTLSAVQINETYFQFPIASKQLPIVVN